MPEYKILLGLTHEALEAEVLTYLRENWRLCGGCFHTGLKYGQAITRDL